MKIKHILIVIGSMLLLWVLLQFSQPPDRPYYDYSKKERVIPGKTGSVIISVIGIGILLSGVFWKKQ